MLKGSCLRDCPSRKESRPRVQKFPSTSMTCCKQVSKFSGDSRNCASDCKRPYDIQCCGPKISINRQEVLGMAPKYLGNAMICAKNSPNAEGNARVRNCLNDQNVQGSRSRLAKFSGEPLIGIESCPNSYKSIPTIAPTKRKVPSTYEVQRKSAFNNSQKRRGRMQPALLKSLPRNILRTENSFWGIDSEMDSQIHYPQKLSDSLNNYLVIIWAPTVSHM